MGKSFSVSFFFPYLFDSAFDFSDICLAPSEGVGIMIDYFFYRTEILSLSGSLRSASIQLSRVAGVATIKKSDSLAVS